MQLEVRLKVKVDMSHVAPNLVLVDVGDVVDGKCVTKGRSLVTKSRPLGDLGEPGHKVQLLWGGRPSGKGKGKQEGNSNHHNTVLLGINLRL